MTNFIHKKLFSNKFSERLLKWNRKFNKRAMPWKGEKDPYKIWLSEVILQQTRVDQGLKYYENFTTSFSDIFKLAKAPDQQVFKMWEGLGYYSRCRNLITSAKYIAGERNGKFPSTYEEILKLKGVGPYTAAAIASFAFNLPHAVIDGNVFRVLARVFGIETPIDSTEGKKLFTDLANELLDKSNSAEYNQAIMDFGATVCKPLAPLCDSCVFNSECVAFNTSRLNALPVKEKKIQKKTRHFYFFVISYKNKLVVRERAEADIWRHLYEFPLIATDNNAVLDLITGTAIKNGWFQNEKEVYETTPVFTQKLTHQTIKGIFILVQANKKPLFAKDYRWIQKREITTIAFPKMINDFMNKGYL